MKTELVKSQVTPSQGFKISMTSFFLLQAVTSFFLCLLFSQRPAALCGKKWLVRSAQCQRLKSRLIHRHGRAIGGV